MFRNMWQRVALVLTFLVLLSPIIFSGASIDYDAKSTIAAAKNILNTQSGYVPKSHPGSPVYDLVMTFLFHLLQSLFKISELHWERIGQFISLMFASILCFFIHKDLRENLKDLPAFFAALVIVSHPIFLWPSFSLTEDMSAMALGYLGWRLVRKDGNGFWAALLCAVACNCKALAITFFVGSLVLLFMRKDTSKLIHFFATFLLLAFLLYLPSLAYFQMHLGVALTTTHYGSVPEDRIVIGWDLVRKTVLYAFPVVITLGIGFAKSFRHRKKLSLSSFDMFVFLFALATTMTFRRYHLLDFALVTLLYWGWKQYSKFKTARKFLSSLSPEILSYWAMLAAALFIGTNAPYSRSFLLPILFPAAFLMAHRFQSRFFWISSALLAWIPMVIYFELAYKAPRIKIYGHGFYKSLITGAASEYNDYGFSSQKPLFEL